MNANEYVIKLKKEFESRADAVIAKPMKKYMKNKFGFLGLNSPIRKELQKKFFSEFGLPKENDFESVIKQLWELDEREYQYAAIEISIRFSKKSESKLISLFEFMIVNKSWWDTVDGISSWLVAAYFLKFPEEKNKVISNWLKSNNIWLQRACLLFQLKYKTKTDTELLINCIEKLKSINEFFIQKAIGWALREYSKTDSEFVINYANSNNLSNFAQKEALKWLKKRG